MLHCEYAIYNHVRVLFIEVNHDKNEKLKELRENGDGGDQISFLYSYANCVLVLAFSGPLNSLISCIER